MWLGWKSGVAITRPFFKKNKREGRKYELRNYQNNWLESQG